MKGGIYTKEKCPVCQERFKRIGEDLLCATHQTRPRKLFVQLYSKEISGCINLYTDSRGYPFTSHEQASRILNKIRAEIDAGTFDPSRYISQHLKPLKFKNWAEKWLQNRQIEGDKKIISPSYLKELKRFVAIFKNFFQDTDIGILGRKRSTISI
jgi:hypothetical protein